VCVCARARVVRRARARLCACMRVAICPAIIVQYHHSGNFLIAHRIILCSLYISHFFIYSRTLEWSGGDDEAMLRLLGCSLCASLLKERIDVITTRFNFPRIFRELKITTNNSDIRG
jgi:hypothetical protein